MMQTGSTVASVPRQVLRFLLHQGFVYILAEAAAPVFAGAMRRVMMRGRSPEPVLQFLHNHLFFFVVVPSIVAGVAHSEYRHRVALYVWAVPAVILAYMFCTFPQSVLDARFLPALHHYFSGDFLIPNMTPAEIVAALNGNTDFHRAWDQSLFTAPFYAGVTYSLAMFVSMRMQLVSRLSEFTKQFRSSAKLPENSISEASGKDPMDSNNS